MNQNSFLLYSNEVKNNIYDSLLVLLLFYRAKTSMYDSPGPAPGPAPGPGQIKYTAEMFYKTKISDGGQISVSNLNYVENDSQLPGNFVLLNSGSRSIRDVSLNIKLTNLDNNSYKLKKNYPYSVWLTEPGAIKRKIASRYIPPVYTAEHSVKSPKWYLRLE